MGLLMNSNNILLDDWASFVYNGKQRKGKVIQIRGRLITLQNGKTIKSFHLDKVQGEVEILNKVTS